MEKTERKQQENANQLTLDLTGIHKNPYYQPCPCKAHGVICVGTYQQAIKKMFDDCKTITIDTKTIQDTDKEKGRLWLSIVEMGGVFLISYIVEGKTLSFVLKDYKISKRDGYRLPEGDVPFQDKGFCKFATRLHQLAILKEIKQDELKRKKQ